MKFWYADSYARKVRQIECTLAPGGLVTDNFYSAVVPQSLQPLKIGIHIFVNEADAYTSLLERMREYKQKISADIIQLTDERDSKDISIEFLTALIAECDQRNIDAQDLIDPTARKERLRGFIAKIHDMLYMTRHRLKSDGETICELRKQLEARQNPVIVDEPI